MQTRWITAILLAAALSVLPLGVSALHAETIALVSDANELSLPIVSEALEKHPAYGATKREQVADLQANPDLVEAFQRDIQMSSREVADAAMVRRQVAFYRNIIGALNRADDVAPMLILRESYVGARLLKLAGQTIDAQAQMDLVQPLAEATLTGSNGALLANFRELHADLLIANGFTDRGLSMRLLAAASRVNVLGKCYGVDVGTSCWDDAELAAGSINDTAWRLILAKRPDDARGLVEKSLGTLEAVWNNCADNQLGPCASRLNDRAIMLRTKASLHANLNEVDAAAPVYNDIFQHTLATSLACNCNLTDLEKDLGSAALYRRLSGNSESALEIYEQGLPILLAEFPEIGRLPQDQWPRSNRSILRKSVLGEISNYLRLSVIENAEHAADLTGFFSSEALGGDSGRARAFLTQNNAASLFEELYRGIAADGEINDLRRQARSAPGAEGVTLFDKALEIALQQGGRLSVDYYSTLNERADKLVDAGEIVAALDDYEEVVAIEAQRRSTRAFRVQSLIRKMLPLYRQAGAMNRAAEFLDEYVAVEAGTDVLAFWQAYDADPRSAPYMRDDLIELIGDNVRLKYEQGANPELLETNAILAWVGRQTAYQRLGFGVYSQAEFRSDLDGGREWERPVRDDYTMLADVLWQNGERSADAKANRDDQTSGAFQLLQQASRSAAEVAVGRAAAEQYAIVQGAGDLHIKRERLMAEAALINTDTGSTSEERDAARQINFAVREVNLKIEEKAPDYFRFIRPGEVLAEDAQALMGPKDAILLMVPSEYGTHVMVVVTDQVHWWRSPLTADALAEKVNALRSSLDQRLDRNNEFALPFDRAASYSLYNDLLEPFEEVLKGKDHLFVAAQGALSSLPLSVLVTTAPTGDDADPEALRATAWLDKRFTLVQIPSIQSLQYLRQLQGAKEHEGTAQEFIGYGNPVLEGQFVPGERMSRSGAGFTDVTNKADSAGNVLADTEKLRALPKLPKTKEELDFLARALLPRAHRRQAVRTGTFADEAMVKQADLSRVNVLAFATHGLLAGEEGASEPGLVLTPPDTATQLNDGFLTASEITALKLSADWVILSACNTAAGDEPGAPGLSGLARAFFYAGARSLLASHWPVLDDVAPLITVNALRPVTGSGAEITGLRRSQAFRHSVTALREDESQPLYAHPAAWAPFVLVGDK